MTTIPEVFIIESSGFDDERHNRFEGKIITNILDLNGKSSVYYYIRTERELEEIAQIFYETNYRYLHLSCHGNSKSMATTLDVIPFKRLSEILSPYLCDRRLFISACEMVNTALASAIIPRSNCYSIIGPSVEVAFSDSAILWASFYHLMFSFDSATMKREELLRHCHNLVNLFRVPLNYYSISRISKNGYKLTAIKPREIINT